jgi:hypothetical protein
VSTVGPNSRVGGDLNLAPTLDDDSRNQTLLTQTTPGCLTATRLACGRTRVLARQAAGRLALLESRPSCLTGGSPCGSAHMSAQPPLCKIPASPPSAFVSISPRAAPV